MKNHCFRPVRRAKYSRGVNVSGFIWVHFRFAEFICNIYKRAKHMCTYFEFRAAGREHFEISCGKNVSSKPVLGVLEEKLLGFRK